MVKIKWNKKDDTFTIDRKTLAEIVDFAYYPDWLKKKDRPIGYAEFRKKVLNLVMQELICYSRDNKYMKKLMKNIVR